MITFPEDFVVAAETGAVIQIRSPRPDDQTLRTQGGMGRRIGGEAKIRPQTRTSGTTRSASAAMIAV